MTTFGSLFLAVGLILAGVSVSFLTGADRAPGTVVSLDWRAGHSTGTSRTNSGPMAYPVVEFTPAHGTPRTFRGSTGSNPPSYGTGDRVEVLYHANSPEDARINGFASLWLLPLIFGGIGLAAVVIATVVARLTRRRPASSGPSASRRGSRPDVPASSRVG
ncbi:DUF3592 domain-containing protein [Streptomyces sp. W16]|uniref:DUF3592 domain-containing protein n=1 Tax=Streptomyces sp. W16 TaxID=3076631 RepID=UPI00295B8865|nr:DUF3592 domain-containing protein [Streptomyces sp. W16]MDV9171659.1 DUF3592 domain-containing protein [Streptomyces sp. W16]